jgi:hypothetical protein
VGVVVKNFQEVIGKQTELKSFMSQATATREIETQVSF